MNVCFWHDLGRTQYTEMRTSLEAETACLCPGRSGREITVTSYTELMLDLRWPGWSLVTERAESRVVTSTRDIRTLQPAVTFTLSSRLLTHWPHCQARWRSKGQEWVVTLQSLATDGDKYEARTEPAPDVTHCTRDSGLRSGFRPSGIGNMAFSTSVR